MSLIASVILPTYERPDRVLRALESLAQQDLDPTKFEVLIIDDGSSYGAARVADRAYPFQSHYHRKANAGATIARNYGVDRAMADVFVFMDDDVMASTQALSALLASLMHSEKQIWVAQLIDQVPTDQSLAEMLATTEQLADDHAGVDQTVPFSACNTQMLAVRRKDYEAIGRLQDPTGGWPNWDDVDFGYRAHLAGFTLISCGQAVAAHWDSFRRSTTAANQRWQRAAHSAARLFERHPEMQPHIPMFIDKAPIGWRTDSPGLILRKLVRSLSAAGLVFWLLEAAVKRTDHGLTRGRLQRVIRRWLRGAYLYRGFRKGLGDLAASSTS